MGIFAHSRETVDYAPDRVVSADTGPGLEISSHGPFPAHRPSFIDLCQLSEEQDNPVNNMVVNGMTLTLLGKTVLSWVTCSAKTGCG